MGRQKSLRLCAEIVAEFNTSRLMKDAKSGWADWERGVLMHEQMAGLLATVSAADVPAESSPRADGTGDTPLLSRLDAMNNCLGSKGAHGHSVFLEICREKLPDLLQEWTRERPWIVEVGCSREIIEGQNSTAQLLELARELELPFAGIDLDHGNIAALKRDYEESNASWITGKGEEELQTWGKPIAACYLDAYDFWHTSHSELRQKAYVDTYGSEINDAECHTMHLDAARHCTRLIPPDGILGLDDTWREDNQWVGKGALAMPWLLDHGWQLLSSANRSIVLLKQGEDR
jgi:hypothetical protein